MTPAAESTMHVLLIEDHAGDARLLSETLADLPGETVRLSWTKTLLDGMHLLEGEAFDAVLLDLSLPDSQGLATLLTLTQASGSRTPIIVLTGLDDESMAARALREGAQDYLLKGQFSPTLLRRALRYAIDRKESELALRDKDEQLRQAQRMETIGRLAGGIAHDFNNMLTVIEGYARLLLDTLDAADPHRRDVEAIHGAARRAANLTNQLLAFSRKQAMRPRVIDLNTIVREFGDILGHTLGEDIKLTLTETPDLEAVWADPGQIEQIILNLTLNARDAMPAGGTLAIECRNVSIDESWVRRHRDVQPGHYVQLAVTDSGVGMPDTVKQQIFDPFFTTKPFGQGTGMGLSTVYGIVRQSGGHVWVYSEPGRGTTVKVNFPVHRGGAAEAAASEPPPGNRPGTKRVLLIEDEPELLIMLQTYLTRMGYDVLPARDADSAIEALERTERAVDLVISDLVLPNRSGPQIVESLREMQSDLPVLYMSAYPGDSVVQRGFLKADTPFISKPFTPEQLAERIRDVLARHRASTDGTARP